MTILSSVRVNYSLADLKQMICTRRQNVPSYDLKKDYPEMLEQPATAPKKKKKFFNTSSESD